MLKAPSLETILTEVLKKLPNYEPRPQQVEMAQIIAQGIKEQRPVLVEAGTGCGKTMAYLIPVLLSGKRAVISTGTLALQTQLVEKDLVFLAQHFPLPFKFALAKGRGNYLCPPKLLETQRLLPPNDPKLPLVEELIKLWRSGKWNGDVGTLPFPVPSTFWCQDLCSSVEECHPGKCVGFEKCCLRQARKACEEADIIVTNHALYFTHLASEEAVLPPHHLVVFDEAHHLEEMAIRTLGVEIPRWATRNLILKVERRTSPLPPRVREPLIKADTALLEWVDQKQWRSQRLPPEDPEIASIAQLFLKALGNLSLWLQGLPLDQIRLFADTPELAKIAAGVHRDSLLTQTGSWIQQWEHFAHLEEKGDWVHWLEADPSRQSFSLCSAPLEVGQLLQEHLWTQKHVILTSATLAVEGDFQFLQNRLNIPSPITAVLDSPFDYSSQALLYLPRGLPHPNSQEFNQSIIPVIEDLLRRTRGRAFVLFTSYRSLREVSSQLIHRLPFPCKTQEDLPKGALIEWFRTTPHSVLFATASFWEGVDIPGEALSCVIIDRLPFAHPDNPIVQATTDRLKAERRDWFNEYALPRAILMLKQGFGRLIRSKTDRGVVAILDSRLSTMNYGKKIIRSLPPARRIFSLEGGEVELLLNSK